MRLAFLSKALDRGGAQKMLSFVINSVACLADEVLIILEEQGEISYKLPENSNLIVINKSNNRGKTLLSKAANLMQKSIAIRKILIEKNVDVICAFGVYYSLMACIASKKTKTKTIVSERRSPANLDTKWKIISSYLYPKCDMVVFQLDGARDFYKRMRFDRSSVIPNPYFISENSASKGNDERLKEVVMAAARLEYEKGFDIGIKAMSLVVQKHPDYKLVIYGGGDFYGMYGDLISSLNLGNQIDFRGFSKEIEHDISSSSIFVLPSRFEGIPNMLMEAMGIGLACVACDCPPGGPRMLFDNGSSGILVDVEDYKGIAHAVCNLIENIDIRRYYEKNAKSVKERFSPEIIAQEWRDCFKRVTDKDIS